MKIKIPQHILSLEPHVFGLSTDLKEGRFTVNDFVSLASNENSWGVSPFVVRALRSALQNQHRYPDGTAEKLKIVLAEMIGLDEKEFLIGNGSSEVLELLVRAFVETGSEVITSHPSFHLYNRFVAVQGGNNFNIPLKNNTHDLESIRCCITENTRLIILDNPNNPTGTAINPGDLYKFLSMVPESVVVVLDEAYVDFMEDELHVDIYSLIRNTEKRCGVVIVRTLSKLYGLAGLRIGYGAMPGEIAEILEKIRHPFNVNTMALVAAVAALQDKNYYENIVEKTKEGRKFLTKEIEKIGCECVASQANFIWVNVKGDSDRFCENMLNKGVSVRSLKGYGFSSAIRVTVGKEEENGRFLDALNMSLQELQYV